MIRVTFFGRGEVLTGFAVEGHADWAPAGEDIVCAAVSSAAYMAANTLTEVCGCRAKIREDAQEGLLSVRLTEEDAPKGRDVLRGLQLHMEGLCRQFAKNIQMDLTEV